VAGSGDRAGDRPVVLDGLSFFGWTVVFSGNFFIIETAGYGTIAIGSIPGQQRARGADSIQVRWIRLVGPDRWQFSSFVVHYKKDSLTSLPGHNGVARP
jgi:hypothetical protein